MPTSLKFLIDNPDLLDKLKLPCRKCASCGAPLSKTLTGKNLSPKGIVCDDCYYEQMSEELEKYPIGHHRVRR